MDKILSQIKEYGGIGFLIIATIISAAISYGTSQATAEITSSNFEKRILVLETDDKIYGQAIAKIEQKVDDLWHDNGHKE